MTWWVWLLAAVPVLGVAVLVLCWLAISLQAMREGLEEEP